MHRPLALFIAFGISSVLLADTVELNTGVKVEGTVMKSTEDRVFIRIDQSTFVYPRSFVTSIEIDKKASAAASKSRLPSCEVFLDKFVAQK